MVKIEQTARIYGCYPISRETFFLQNGAVMDDFSTLIRRFSSPTLAQIVEDLQAHIPHDDDREEDELLLRDHGNRYRRFQKEQT
jgi:hypothetical protein